MYEQLLAHLVGDYVLQTDHMASQKTKSFAVACWHAFVYSIPFFFLSSVSCPALLVIVSTHAVIDRYPFSKASWHGYTYDKPDWLAGWLLIIVDNIIHLVINYFALKYLG
jgi:hypothetical protein